LAASWGLLHCAVVTDDDETAENLGEIEQRSIGARFGTECQKDFQGSWATTLPNVWDHCAYFNDELNDTDSQVFYYSLHGQKWNWENGGDQTLLDNVNLFYANTHGGFTASDAQWAMWDSWTTANSSNMRLGDEAYGLSIFVTYACKTMKSSDNNFWPRWDSIFNGGLRIALGSHGDVFDSSTTNEVGEDFAEDLQSGWSFRNSWYDALTDWNVDNDGAVATTGTDMNDCWNRQNNMNWQNYPSWTRLRDGQNGWVCYSNWDNL
jgi:hypothetical protein